MRQTRIIIFAKAPQPGFAKTRLIPALGVMGASELARNMLLNTVQEALDAQIGVVELCVTPGINDDAWKNIPLPTGLEISTQCIGDLGDRLAFAAQRALEQSKNVLLIGTDCVEMSSVLLHTAAQALREHDAIIHCTADGGYAMLGLRRYSPSLFRDMPWSTDAVSSTTIMRIRQLGWSVHVGQTLHDVDEPQDLKYVLSKWCSEVG